MTAQAAAPLHLLSAGAAQGLVAALAPAFSIETGVALDTAFNAVGAIREMLATGARCDALILTDAMIMELEAAGRVASGTRTALGRVRTGIGVRTGDAIPDIADRAALEQTIRAASDIFLPDPQRATAGIHFVRVLEQLGVYRAVQAQLRPYPNGASAMRALSESTGPTPLGCTQITEIKYTKGVTLVGALPREFELATIYSVAVWADAQRPDIALRFAQSLAGPHANNARAAAGFET
ncbi:MAG: substrate-binding domain-containing protein [Burkholderiaceae bacterium]